MQATSRLALLAALCCPAAFAAELVRDINSQPVTHAGYVQPWTASLTAGVLFIADDNVHGEELWISDGTVPGTHLVRDVNAGKPGSEIYGFTVVNGVAYFHADDGVNGSELWRSDGTYAGTRIVANIGPGSQAHGGNGSPVPVGGGILIFTADDGVHGQELWRSDGTAAGTWIVADIAAGAASPDIDGMIGAGNRVFFKATDSAGNEPWVSDGTAAGTHRVADINPGAASSTIGSGGVPGSSAAVGGTVFFAAYDPVHGAELWRLRAGEPLAALVIDLNTELAAVQPPVGQPAHTLGSDPQKLTVSGDSVLFSAVTTSGSTRTNKLYRATAGSDAFVPLNNLEPFDVVQQILPVGARGAVFGVTSSGMTEVVRPIMVTDGTTAGSQSMTAQNLWFTNFTSAMARSANGNEVYFFAHVPNSGDIDLWRSDGTVANTRVFADVNDITGSWDITRVGSRLFFSAGSFGDGHGKEMWVSDGTPAGTRMIRDLNPGQDSSQPYAPKAFGDRVMFAAFTSVDPATFWVTDGTDGGTLPLAKIPVDFETQASGPYSIGASATNIFYLADDGITGRNLWTSDGTTAGTALVRDFSPGTGGISSLPMMSLGSVQIFNDRDVLWRTDGTTAGTYPLGDTAPGAIGDVWWPVYEGATSVSGGTGYFFANDGARNTLWRTDGSIAGTTMLADVTATSPWVLGIAGAVGSRILYQGVNGSNGNTLYSTDGTPAGTVVVSATHQISGFAKTFNGRLCFTGNDGIPHTFPGGSRFFNDIWCSNGNAGDLVRITDGNAHDRNAGEFFVADNLMFVNSYSQDSTSGLWVTDGNPATSRQLITEHASDVARYGSHYLIATYDNPAGPRFLLSDGTTAGTRDLLQGANVDGTVTGHFVLFANYVVFTVRSSKGVVIWRTDGTPAGTRFVADVNPSTSDDQYPLDFRVLGSRLLFTSTHPVFNEELWVLTAVNPNATDDTLRVVHGTTTGASVLDNDADIDGTLDATSVQVVDAPASGTTTINAASGAISYTPNAGFTGLDSLTYRVRDTQGNWSNPGRLSIVVAQPTGGAPANAPANITPAPMPLPPSPPPVTPPVTPPTTPPANPSGGGGGGALGLELMLLGLVMLARRGRQLPR